MKKFKSEEQTQDEISYYADQLKEELGEEYFTQKLAEQFKQEATKHQSQDHDLFDFAQTFLKQQKRAVIERHFEDRVKAEESGFLLHGKKSPGAMKGYVAKKKTDENGFPFMIKKAEKSWHEDAIANTDEMCFVNELITAPLYKRTLYDRAPIIAEVEASEAGEASFRSKFLHDFQTVSEFTYGDEPNAIGEEYEKLRSVKGAEKVFAAALAWGEYDIHAGNIGVMEISKGEFVLAKIDHGWSGTEFFTDPAIVLKNFAHAYKEYGYQGLLPLDAGKLKDALDEITNVSDEEIEKLVKAQVYKLKQSGFELKDLRFTIFEDQQFHGLGVNETTKTFDSFEELEKHYIDRYKKQMGVIRELSKRLDIILKIDFDDPANEKAWKEGGWLQDIKGKDPFLWALENGKTIQGRDPLEVAIEHKEITNWDELLTWALENNRTVEGKDPLQWAMENKEIAKWDGLLAWALENNKTVEGKDPIQWALDNKDMVGWGDLLLSALESKKSIEIEGKNVLLWAAEHADIVKWDGLLAWAVRNGGVIDGDDPIVWALENNKTIEGNNPLAWASENKDLLDWEELLESGEDEILDWIEAEEKLVAFELLERKDAGMLQEDLELVEELLDDILDGREGSQELLLVRDIAEMLLFCRLSQNTIPLPDRLADLNREFADAISEASVAYSQEQRVLELLEDLKRVYDFDLVNDFKSVSAKTPGWVYHGGGKDLSSSGSEAESPKPMGI